MTEAKKYRVTNPTLDGKPAGPDLGDNYLSYSDGDVVFIIREGRLFGGEDPDVVVISSELDGFGEQEVDRSSLVEVVE